MRMTGGNRYKKKYQAYDNKNAEKRRKENYRFNNRGCSIF